ncbi:MAG: beta-lactamase family protein [Candidatus Eisenbacteria bacterium]|nr:beta-lactamase family protein [Candidatus Eisenbacteria bacterium]
MRKRARSLIASSILVLVAATASEADRSPIDLKSAVERGLPALELNGFQEGVPWDTLGAALPTAGLLARMAHYGVPGLGIAVVQDGAVAWAEGYGVLEAGREAPVTRLTRFEAASASKAVTAVAVLRFVDRGLLDIDADVNTLLTSWNAPENEHTGAHKVTVRRLLTHTAGINRPDGGFSVEPGSAPTTAQVLRGERPAVNTAAAVEFIPGSMHQYSNMGYVILQLLLEEAGGKPFPELMEDEVFLPLGMERSGYETEAGGARGSDFPRHHGADGEPLESALFPGALAHGGLRTTPADLARLIAEMSACYRGETAGLLSPRIVRAAFSAERRFSPDGFLGFAAQGLGVFLLQTDHGPCFCHPGHNMPGATCFYFGFPETGQGAVVMTNGVRGLELSFEVLCAIASIYDWPSIRVQSS